MVNRFLTTLSLLLTSAVTCLGVDTMTGIFDPRMKTLQVTVNDRLMLPDVLVLGTDDHVTISFDELAEDRSYLRYSLVHCDARWLPSAIVETEYIDGFNEGLVEDYDYSRGTATHYVHYSITLPNADFRFKISGNYLLRVYSEDDPETTLLQARFMVSESAVEVRASATSRTDIDYNDEHQQLSIEVDATRFPLRDIYNDLFVVVAQNGRLDNAVALRQPLRVSGQRAFYEHQRPLIFEAGNEYRRMETVSLTYPTMGVDQISYFYPYYHHQLLTDRPRSESRYLYDQTQRGRFLTREYNSDRSDVEAEYTVVHFSLEMPRLAETELFLDGDFTLRRFDPDSRMIYNEETGRYEKDLLLKQGAYNYQYLALPKGATKGTPKPVEGNRYQTVNEYLILVYTRFYGERYDRLIGATLVVTNN